jgi:hypothetical protein
MASSLVRLKKKGKATYINSWKIKLLHNPLCTATNTRSNVLFFDCPKHGGSKIPSNLCTNYQSTRYHVSIFPIYITFNQIQATRYKHVVSTNSDGITDRLAQVVPLSVDPASILHVLLPYFMLRLAIWWNGINMSEENLITVFRVFYGGSNRFVRHFGNNTPNYINVT